MLRKFCHRGTLIDKQFLCRLTHLRFFLKTRQINLSLMTQKIQNAPAYTVHSIETERHPARGIIALHRLDQPDRPLLHRIHHGRQCSVRHDLTKDQRLIGLDDPPPRTLITAFLIGAPEFPLLLRRKFLHSGKFFYIVRKHGHTSFDDD